MEKYDYRQVVKDDVLQYLEENNIKVTKSNRDELRETLYDDMFVDDSVTGNASGSYTFCTYTSEENLMHNLDLLGEALSEFGCGPDYLIKNGPEACDVTIRCYLLGQVLDEVLDEVCKEFSDDDWKEACQDIKKTFYDFEIKAALYHLDTTDNTQLYQVDDVLDEAITNKLNQWCDNNGFEEDAWSECFTATDALLEMAKDMELEWKI